LQVKDAPIRGMPLFQYESAGQMEFLSLSGTAIGDDWLMEIERLSKLRSLDISGTQITTEGMLAARWPTSLMDLNVSRTRLTPGCLQTLHSCRNLWRLRVEYCGIPKGEIEELKQALPRCEVFWAEGSVAPP
jgi:hypothetical protein